MWTQFWDMHSGGSQKEVHGIYAKDIKEGERQGILPEQGYVWVD